MKSSLLCAVMNAAIGALYVVSWISGDGIHNLILGAIWGAAALIWGGTAYFAYQTKKIRNRR